QVHLVNCVPITIKDNADKHLLQGVPVTTKDNADKHLLQGVPVTTNNNSNTRNNVFTSVLGAIFDFFKAKSDNSSVDTKLASRENEDWIDDKDNKTINLGTMAALDTSVLNNRIDTNNHVAGNGGNGKSDEKQDPLLVYNISSSLDSIGYKINKEGDGQHGTKNGVISSAINLYGLAIPPADTDINSVHDKENTKNENEVGNYINAQFAQIKELSNKKPIVRTGKHQIDIGPKDLMEVYQPTKPAEVRNSETNLIPTVEAIDTIEHSGIHRPELAFVKNTNGVSRKRIKKKKRKKSRRKSKKRTQNTNIDQTKKESLTQSIIKSIQTSQTTSSKPISPPNIKSIQSAVKPRKEVPKVSKSFNPLEQLVNMVMSAKEKPKHPNVKPRHDVSKVSNKFKKLKELVSLAKSVKEPKALGGTHNNGKFRTDVKHAFGTRGKKGSQQRPDRKMKPHANSKPKSFEINIKSANKESNVKEQKYQVHKQDKPSHKQDKPSHKQDKPSIKRISNDKGYQIKSSNNKGKQNLNYIVTSKGDSKTNTSKHQLDPDYIVTGSMDRTKNHHFKNEKGQAPTHKFASHIINDLVQRGFLEENYASGMPTKKKSKTNAKFIDEQFRKPNDKFIDEQFRQSNAKFIDEQFRQSNAKFIDEQFRKPKTKFKDEQIRKPNAKFIDEQFRKPNSKFIDEQFRKPNAKFIDEQFKKPKMKFIDEQFSKPNNKHSIKILPASQTPERDYFRISPRVIESDYSEVIHSTVEPVPSQKPSVMSELMKIGFVDKFTLPIIDRKKSNNIKQETMSRSKLDSSQYTVLETKDKANNFNEQTVNGNIISKNIAGQTGKNKPNEKNTNAQNPNSQTILSKDLKILELMKLGFIDKDTKDLTKSDVTRVMQDIEGTKALQEHLQSSVKLSINSKAIAQNYRSTSSNIDSPKENERQEDTPNNKQIVPSDYKVSNILIGEAKTITDNQKHRENNEKTISKDNKILELMKMGFIDEPTLPIIDLTKTDVIKITSKTGDSEVKNTNENKQIDRLNSERVNIINRDVTLVNRDGQLKSELINLVLKDGTEKLNDIEVGVYNKQTQDNIEGKAPLKTTKLPKRKTKLKFNETINSTQNVQLQLNRSKAERQINQSRKYLNQKKIDQQQFIASIIRKQKEKWKKKSKKSKKSKKLHKSKTQNAQLQFNKSVDVNDKEKRKIQDTIINKENIIKSDNTNTHLQLNMLLSERKINQSGKSLNIKSQAESNINQSGKSLNIKSQAESHINQSGKSLNTKKLDPKEFIASIIRKQKEKWKKKSRSRMKNKTKSRIQTKSKSVIGAQTNESVLEFVENPSRMNVIAKSEIGTLDNEDVTDQLKFNHSITGSPMNLKDSLQNAPKKAKKLRRRKQKKTPNGDKSKIANNYFIMSETDDNTKTKNEDVIIDETNKESSQPRALKKNVKNLLLEIKELGGRENESTSSDRKSDKDDQIGNTIDSGNVGWESILKTSSLEGKQASPTKIENKLYLDNDKLTIKHDSQNIKAILQRINDLKSKTLESELLLSLALDRLSKSGNVQRVVKTDHNIVPINTSQKPMTENLTLPLILDKTIEATHFISADNKEMLKLLEKDLTSPLSQSDDNKDIKIKEIKLLKKELTTPLSQSVDDKDIKIKEISTSKSPSKKDDLKPDELYPHTVRGIPKSLLKHDVDMIIQKTVLSGRKAKTSKKQRTKSKKAKEVELAKNKSKEDRKLLPVNLNTLDLHSESQRSENNKTNEEGDKSLKLSNQNEASTNDDAKMTPQKRKETSKTGNDDKTIKSMKTISKEISPTHESSLTSMDSILHATNIPSKKHSKEISPTHESSLSSIDSTLHATNIPSKKQTDDISEPIMPNQMPVKSSDELPPIKPLQHVYTNKTTKTISSEKTNNETMQNENDMKSIKIQNLTNQTLDGIETKQVSSSEILDTAVIDKSPLENTFDEHVVDNTFGEPGNEESADSNLTMKQTDTKDNNKHVVDNDDTNTAEVDQDKLLTAGNIIKTNEDIKGRVTPRDKNVSIISIDKQSRQSVRDRNDPKTTKGVKGIVIMGETVPFKERSDRVQLGDRNIKKSKKDEDSIKRKDENDFIKQLRDLKEKLMSDAANEKSTSGNDEDGVSSVDTIVKGRNKKKPLVSKKDLKDMYKEMNYSDPKINVPDVSSNTNRRNKKFPQIHSVPSGRGGVNSVSYSAILRSLRKEGGNQPKSNKPSIVGEQFLGASSNFDYPTTTSKQDLVPADKQGPTPTVPTSAKSGGLVSAPRVDRTENTKWASLASGIMQRDKKAPGVVIDNKRTSIVGGKKWPAMVAQHLQWTDTAPNSMSLSVGHNTDGRYISDPSTGRDRYRGTIDKVNSGMHLNGQGVLNVRPTQSKTADNDHLFENILNSLVDVAMDSPYLEQQKRGSIVDQPRGVVVEKSIKTHPSNGNPPKPMYNQRDRHNNMHNNREMMDPYRISSVPVPQHTDRNSNTQVNRIKDQNSVDLSLGYQQTTSTQPPNLFTYGKSSQNYWWHDRQVKGRKSDVLTFSGANVPSNSMQRRLGNNRGNSAKSTLQNPRVSNSDINRSRPRNRHDRISMVGAPDMGFHSRDQGIESHSREPDMGFHSRDQGIELHSREPDMGLHYRDSGTGLHSREPDIGLHSRDPLIGLHSREPDTGLHSRDPGIRLHSREPDMGLNSRDPGIGLHGREPDMGLHSRDPRIELHSRDPRIELHSREPDMGLHYRDSGIGLHSREPDIGLHSRDPRIGLHSREPDPGLHSRDPGIGLHNREPDIGLHSRDPRIGLHSSDPRIGLHSERAYDLHNNGEIQSTDVNLSNKPSQMYSNIELPGLKAPGLQIRPIDTPKKTNIQFGGLSIASNGANDHQGQIQMQGEPNRSIQPDQRLTNKKTIHLMPGIRGAHDILSLQNQQHSEPALTDTQTPTVPYSRLVPPEDAQYNTIPGSPNYGFPFEMSLHQFQHSNNQGTRRKRVISPQEMAGNHIHYDVGPANEVSSNNLNPNDYAYETSGQPHEVVVNINIMKNLSKVCAPHERFTCNPVENNVAVSDLRSMCMSSCSNGVCPVDKCSCFCVSLTTLDVKNIIVASNKRVPSRQTNSLGHILENSGTGTRNLPKTVNIIGIDAGRQGTSSPNLPKSVNIIGLNSGSNLPKNSNTVNNIAMEAGNLGTSSHNPSKTVIINGMNAENSLIDFPQPYETVNSIGLNAGNLGTSSHTPSKTVNILGMNAENSLNGFPPQPFETVNNIGLPAPPTTLNTANMIGSAGNYFLPHDFKPRVTCTPTSLFLSIKGMVDWCNTECGKSLDNCPWHICECQFIL
ncbi:Hypothetical predicted protein, partial [Mytilus galloprovincialis]